MAVENPFAKKSLNPPLLVEAEKAKPTNVKTNAVIDKRLADKQTNNLSKKQAILEKHGGLESNIPINSPYWRL